MDVGHLPRLFHADFDLKLIGDKCLQWINNSRSKIIAPPTKIQSTNGITKHTWRTVVQVDRTYLTDKQRPCEYWYWDILHGFRMINNVPGRINRNLTPPLSSSTA